MSGLEELLGLFVAAVILAAAARRIGAPYPVFLAVGGAILALLPIHTSFTLPPELALALFVAPVLLDAAYDTSLRDLRDNWLPVTGLVIFAVGLTTAAVAVVTRAIVPAIPWAPAIALGAIVAPPDAVAATAVLRALRPPQRHPHHPRRREPSERCQRAAHLSRSRSEPWRRTAFSLSNVAPTFLLAVAGSVIVGPALGWMTLQVMDRVQHMPTSIILQFVTTFGVWLLAERLGLSAVLTMVCYAMTVAQTSPARTPARIRIPTYAVWETVVFALNVLAFVFIGLQIRPILDALEPGVRGRYFAVSAAVLVTVIVVRFAWHMSFNAVIRWRDRRFGFHPPRPMLRPTVGSGLVISWAGMRGHCLARRGPRASARVSISRSHRADRVLGRRRHPRHSRPDAQTAAARAQPARRRSGRSRSAHRPRPGAARGTRRASPTRVRQWPTSCARSLRRISMAMPKPPTATTARHPAHGELHERALQAARQEVIAMRGNDEIGGQRLPSNRRRAGLAGNGRPREPLIG